MIVKTSKTTSKPCKLGQKKWLLCFHPEKCKCMRIGSTDIDLFTYKLRDSGKGMEFTQAEKDVGVAIAVNYHLKVT